MTNKKILSKDGFTFIKDITKTQAKYPVLSECPVCHHDLHVTKLECEHCSTVLEGSFTLSKFNYLDTEKLYFIEIFVKNRGNIKAIEKEMNLSYPTIKKMLDEVITVLGYNPEGSEETPSQPLPPPNIKSKLNRTEVLDKLEKGEITVAEAIETLGKL